MTIIYWFQFEFIFRYLAILETQKKKAGEKKQSLTVHFDNLFINQKAMDGNV